MLIRQRIANWLRSKLIDAQDPAPMLMALPDDKYSDIDRLRDFQIVFGTPQGQRVLSQILRWSHLWHSSMSQSATDMAFAEGERNVGLKIIAALSYREKPTKQNQSQP